MVKTPSPTFKNLPRTGHYSWLQHFYADIKLQKKEVGCISFHSIERFSRTGFYKISFQVNCSTEKCGWRHLRFAKKFDDSKAGFDEAKQYVKDNWALIVKEVEKAGGFFDRNDETFCNRKFEQIKA